jgi:hypothetical protein
MLRTYKDEVQSLNIAAQFSRVTVTGPDAEREYQHILNAERDSFHFRAREIQRNVDAQTNLIRTILDENRLFMLARDASQVSSSSDSCIVMIEDAIEEIEQLSKHLQEGSDFYKVIVPKLERLKQQVEDVSARLTIERCEYEDKSSRQQQESEDARMAATFGNGNNSSHHSNGPRSGGAPAQSPASSRRMDPVGPRPGGSRDVIGRPGMLPGVEAVSHSEPVVYVDDEKVASLVAMDFDPDKVVAALKRCDNNIEQALNVGLLKLPLPDCSEISKPPPIPSATNFGSSSSSLLLSTSSFLASRLDECRSLPQNLSSWQYSSRMQL